MIRTNLSTRPFYNERAVRIWLFVIALVVALATLFNVTRVLQYSRADTELVGRASNDESRAGDLRQQAARLRATIDARSLDVASTDARQANELIDRRTFSWTDLFNRFETTLPDDVRIVAVRPKVDPKTGIVVGIVVVARGVEDVNKFMENLRDTGEFGAVGPIEEHFDDQGLLVTTLDAQYVPTASNAKAAKEQAR